MNSAFADSKFRIGPPPLVSLPPLVSRGKGRGRGFRPRPVASPSFKTEGQGICVKIILAHTQKQH